MRLLDANCASNRCHKRIFPEPMSHVYHRCTFSNHLVGSPAEFSFRMVVPSQPIHFSCPSRATINTHQSRKPTPPGDYRFCFRGKTCSILESHAIPGRLQAPHIIANPHPQNPNDLHRPTERLRAGIALPYAYASTVALNTPLCNQTKKRKATRKAQPIYKAAHMVPARFQVW